MNIKAILSLCLFLILQCVRARVFVSRLEAASLLARSRRANSPFSMEETKQGSLERECREETCNFEEAREIFEDDQRTNAFWTLYIRPNPCLSNPCQNGGTCQHTHTVYMCVCPRGWEGRVCSQEVSTGQSCKVNNGRCDHYCEEEEAAAGGGRRGAVCSCAPGYHLARNRRSCMATEAFPCGRTVSPKSEILMGNSSEAATDVPTPSSHAANVNSSSIIGDDSEPQASFGQSNHRGRVVGGKECPRGQCPWQVLISRKGAPVCGGTILSPQWILTAAHCTIYETKNLRILAGEHNVDEVEGSEQELGILRIVDHPSFNIKLSYDNDISLIQLSRPIQFTRYALPICLPNQRFVRGVLRSVVAGTVSGWGKLNEFGPAAGILQRLEVPYVDDEQCRAAMGSKVITANMFCAGYETGGQDSCSGDSGGPHATRYGSTWFLTGVVSWGKGCAREGKFGVYTKVLNYLDWIAQTMAETESHTLPEPAQH
ncbi:coagulation factor X-like [Lampetra planeri]